MGEHFDVVIVGAGHGGAQVAVVLRAQGFTGSIALIGDDPHPPYERPPLSKEYLAGDKPFERLMIRPLQFWADRDIVLRTGVTVTSVDAAAKTVSTANGDTIGYGKLVWATGGAARRLSCDGHDLRRVHSVRSRADVDRMMDELPTAARVVVIGGGYIGLEAAAVLAKLGKHVTLIEALPRVLARVAGEELSRFIEGTHRAHGIDVRLGTGVSAIEGDGTNATAVRLADGSSIPADMVVVGIGIIPLVQPLVDAGAAGTNGVLVDAQCRTSLADIYAVGDCALHANGFAQNALIRLESVQNASDQATVAAKDIAGHPAHYDAVPWFWSNQYDLKLQTVGLSIGHDSTVVRRNGESGGMSVIYLRGGKVVALDCVNMTRDYVQGRALVTGGLAIPAALLAEAQTPLKELVQQFS